MEGKKVSKVVIVKLKENWTIARQFRFFINFQMHLRYYYQYYNYLHQGNSCIFFVNLWLHEKKNYNTQIKFCWKDANICM